MPGVMERRRESIAAPRHRKTGKAVRPASRGALDPVLPAPPLDSEKYAYVKRHAWVLTLCSLLSFPPLVYSQVRMMQGFSVFWWYAPFVLLGFICFVLPLLTDRLGRSFDLGEHERLVAAWRPSGTRPSTSSSRCAASRSRCCAIPGSTSRSCASTTRGGSLPTSSTTRPARS